MKFVLILLFFCTANVVFSQTQIEQIDTQIKVYEEKLKQAEDFEEAIPRITVNCNLMQRAIGEVNHFATLYFDRSDEIIELEDDNEEVMEIHTAQLRKVELTLKSGSYETIYTYYYNSNAQLICYQEKNLGDHCYLLTYYYANDRCLKIVEAPLLTAYCTETVLKERTSFSDNDNFFISEQLKKAEQFKELLAVYYKVIAW